MPSGATPTATTAAGATPRSMRPPGLVHTRFLSCLSLSSNRCQRLCLSTRVRLSVAPLLTTRTPLSPQLNFADRYSAADGCHTADASPVTSPVKLRVTFFGYRCRKLTQLPSRRTSRRFRGPEGSKAAPYVCAAISRSAGISALAPYRSTNSTLSPFFGRVAGFANCRPFQLPVVTPFTRPCPGASTSLDV